MTADNNIENNSKDNISVFDRKRIFLCAGGTGGHLFPAIAIAQELKNQKFKPIIFTDERCEKYVENCGIEYFIMPLAKPLGGIKGKFILAWQILKSAAFITLKARDFQPSAFIGFGGYPSIPGIIAGYLTNHKHIYIHEQNSVLGKANRLFGIFARKIFTSYQNTKRVPKLYTKHLFYVGNPVREDILQLQSKEKSFSPQGIFNLFVVGGSQASSVFADVIPQALEKLSPKLREGINLALQARTEDIPTLQTKLNSIKVKAEVSSFFSDMKEKLSASDLVICRSGASTLAEILCVGVPAIFVPLPNSADNHQYHNAEEVSKHSGCSLIEQKDLTANLLAEKITRFISEKENLSQSSDTPLALSLSTLSGISAKMKEMANPSAALEIVKELEL